MNSFEMNKIIGAILGTLLFVMGAGFVAEAIYAPIEDRGPGYALPEPEANATAAAAPAEAAATPLPVLLASADPTAGESVAKKCQACHSFDEGGPNKTGPNLWGVVGRPIASHPGFNYDDALHKLADEEGNWTYENLNAFLTSPKAVAPGTKMTFPGVKKDQERADLLAYLQTLSNDPVPFPAPETAAELPAAPAASNVEAGTAEAQSQQSGAAGNTADASASPQSTGEASVPGSGGDTSKSTGAAASMQDQSNAGDAAAQPAATSADNGAGASNLEMQIANASADKGANVAKKCKACHSFEKDGPNKVGPNLWGIVGRPIASHPGFNYDDALHKLADEEGNWTYANLDAFLTSPKSVAPGTKMSFAGIKKDNERADLLAYLRTLSDTPAPLDGAGQ